MRSLGGVVRMAGVLVALAVVTSCGSGSGSSPSADGSTVDPTATTRGGLPMDPVATAAPPAAGAGVSTRPCDVVLDEHVGTAFGGTATLVGNTIDTNAQECTWTVAGPQLNGTVYVTVRYPDAASQNARATDALALVHYNHDFLIENYPAKVPDIEEVAGVGEYAYLDTWTRTIDVAMAPELALSVQFVAADPGDFGTPISDAVRAALAAAALAVAPDLMGA